jgi:putative transposase
MWVMDRGVENLNGDVDAFFDSGALRRVIAQIDVSFSNSLIEAWWRSLKHRWLFLHALDNLATVKRLVAFYVTDHNERIPHGAFEGQTPDEMYFGGGALVPDELAVRRRDVRGLRLKQNQAAACVACPRAPPAASEHFAV